MYVLTLYHTLLHTGRQVRIIPHPLLVERGGGEDGD